MLEFLNYTFIVRSLLVGSLFSVFAAFLGNFLVAGKRSNMSDMLSHFSLAGVGLGIFLGGGVGLLPIIFSLLAGFSLYFLSNKSHLNKEAFNVLILSLGLAVAIFFVNMSPSSNVSLETYLFGSILTISKSEVWMISSFILIAFGLLLLNYQKLIGLVFDPDFLKSQFKNVKKYELLLMAVTSIFVAISLKIVGGLLVSAFLIISVLSAQQISSSFKNSIFLSIVFNLVSTISGIILSFYYNIPTSSAIIFVLTGIFIFTLISKRYVQN